MSEKENKEIQDLISHGFKGIQIRLDAFEEVHNIIQKQHEVELALLKEKQRKSEENTKYLQQSVTFWIFLQKHPIFFAILFSFSVAVIIWLDIPYISKEKVIEFVMKILT